MALRSKFFPSKESLVDTVDASCRASSINPVARTRRTRSDILQLCDRIHHVVSQLRAMTVRQVFYQLVKLGLVDKTESEYNHVVVRLLTKLRLEGELPWN